MDHPVPVPTRPGPNHDRAAYRQALREIWARSDYDRGFIADPFGDRATAERGLRRVAALLARLGNPHRRYGILHVAGSKGKGGTCAMLDAVLRAAGHRVGLLTSPHLHTFRERIAIGGAMLDESAFAALTRRAVVAADAVAEDDPALGPVTAFELLTAMAFDAFAAAGCDLAVVEVGLGGTYDATNLVDPVVAAITRLDLEHVAILGTTLPEIAANKAGIVKAGRPVVVSPQDPAALATIEEIAAARGSRLLVGGRDWDWAGTSRSFGAIGPWGRHADLRLGLAGPHQVENASTALAALWCLAEAGIAVPEAAIRAGLAAAFQPGRFEVVAGRRGPQVVLDGAHTPASAAALAATLDAECAGRRAVVVLAAGGDKDNVALARALSPIAAAVIATRSRSARAAAPEAVAAAARAAGLAADTAPDVAAALDRATQVAGPKGLILVTGSLYAVAEAREALGLAVRDLDPAHTTG